MADRFSKGALAVLFGQAALAAAAIAFSPKARAAARPYLVLGLRGALALGDEFKAMLDEARLEARHVPAAGAARREPAGVR
jgi:hypothetical protein